MHEQAVAIMEQELTREVGEHEAAMSAFYKLRERCEHAEQCHQEQLEHWKSEAEGLRKWREGAEAEAEEQAQMLQRYKAKVKQQEKHDEELKKEVQHPECSKSG